MTFKRLLITAIGVAISGAAMAAAMDKPMHLVCSDDGADKIDIRLNSTQKFGHTLSCISGPSVTGMTACAPNGGYGLSAPTGSTALVGAVMSAKEYQRHLGGVTSLSWKGEDVAFTGGFMGTNGLQTAWTLKVDLGGSAVFRDRQGSTPYTCQHRSN
ncbi:hypothetical protein HGP17_23740 [Rhizobium sp. P38BS-XIX]|uniref:hypothetical protein n=1 Tax=Rhizobium sp. P38BS-XIX TaxID=2726740 RepID=UPI0014567745|nr:hypothetical protein [Rhizobium sp. P38BS-XIX]NLR99845.1 hypothetical protein [Rhizobium sp. P38BS-XIX]